MLGFHPAISLEINKLSLSEIEFSLSNQPLDYLCIPIKFFNQGMSIPNIPRKLIWHELICSNSSMLPDKLH